MKGEEVKDSKTLAKIKLPEEMIPQPATLNQRHAGRPKATEEHFKIIEDCLRLDYPIWEACAMAGISRDTYYKYYREDPDFALRMDRARQYPKMLARAAVMKRIFQGDSKTALRYLELRDKKRYNTDPNIEDEEERVEKNESKVQFISVASNEWQKDTTNHDIQNDTKQESAWLWYATSWEKQTPWENEEEALKRLDSLNFNNG